MGEAKRRAASRAGASPAPPLEYPGDNCNPQATPPVVPGKSCGTCTKCCTVLAIPELDKPAWQDCRHVAAGRGCTIYPDRPSACRKFVCGWLLDPNMGADLKPENCHVVFFQLNAQNIVATCDADHPGAWREPNVMAFLHSLARSAGTSRKVILMEKGHAWFVTEEAVVPVETG
jgi:uncharacterized protein